MVTEKDLVDKLGLHPHPEGGFYLEMYRSKLVLTQECLPTAFEGNRNCSTAIYYLLPAGTFSAFHKIKSDEVWHFYEGASLQIYVLHLHGSLEVIQLGKDVLNEERYQAMVPAGCWFASRPVGTTNFSLVGCTVAPGFDFADFEMANRQDLLQAYPQHQQLIIELTR